MHIIICLTHENVQRPMGKALQIHTVYQDPYFALQVPWVLVSGTTSHTKISTLVSTYTPLENLYQVLQSRESRLNMQWDLKFITTTIVSSCLCVSLLLHFLVLGGSYTQLWKAVVDRCINSESFSHGLCLPVSPVFMESAGATLEEFTHWSEMTAHSNFCSFHVKPCLTWKLWLLQQTVYINITDEFKPSEAYLLVPSSTSTL